METPKELGNSTEEQALLRAVALWAADYAEQTLAIFESRHPDDTRPRQAIEAASTGKAKNAIRIFAL